MPAVRRAPKNTVARSAPRFAHRGGPPRGEGVRSTSWFVGSSPLPSTTFAGLLAQVAGPRGSVDRAARSAVKMNLRAPHDLGAVCPDDCLVRAARHHCRASSHGVVQRAPLHRRRRRVHSRSDVAIRPSGQGYQPLSVFRPRGFSPPRRLAPLRSCGLVASRSRSWGPPRFRLSRNRLPRDAFPALRSLLPRRQLQRFDAIEVALALSPLCGVTSPPVLLRVRAFTASLALLTFHPPTPHRRLPVCASSKSRAFRALLRLRVRFPHAVCTARGPVAPLGLG
jgi:hypothetical protein